MKPTFALNLSPEGIGLWHRASGGWHIVGEVSLEDPDLQQQLEFLRKTAAELEQSGIATKLIIPNSQILYRTIDNPGDTDDARAKAVVRTMEGATPYPLDQLAIDWQTLPDGRVLIASVARETLAEAEAFAQSNRFNAVSFVACPDDHERFPAEPFFGQAEGAARILPEGERVERDTMLVPLTNGRRDAAVKEPGDQSEGNDPENEASGPLILTGEPEPGTGRPEGWNIEDPAEPVFISSRPKAEEEEQDEEDEDGPDADWDAAADVAPAREAVPRGGGPEREHGPVVVAPRRLAEISDVGMSSRAQVILGLLLIAIAIVLIVSIFMRERIANLFDGEVRDPVAIVQGEPPAQIPAQPQTQSPRQATAEPADDTVEQSTQTGPISPADPFAGMEATTAQIVAAAATVRTAGASAPATEISRNALRPSASAKADPTIIAPERLQAQVPGSHGTRPPDTDALLAIKAAGEAHAPDVAGLDPTGAEAPLPQAPPTIATRQYTSDVLRWLDDMKPIRPVAGLIARHDPPTTLLQAQNDATAVLDMAGVRLPARNDPAVRSGPVATSQSLARIDPQATRLPGTEVLGPRVRRGPNTSEAGTSAEEFAAKRVTSLPPRQDVLLELPTPAFVSVDALLAVIPGISDRVEAYIPGPGSEGSATAPQPDLLTSLSVPDQSVPIDALALRAPEPAPPVVVQADPVDPAASPIEEVVAAALNEAASQALSDEEGGVAPIRPPLAQRPGTFVEPILPPLARRTVANPEPAPIVEPDPVETIVAQTDVTDPVETVVAQTQATDPVAPLEGGIEAIVARLRPAGLSVPATPEISNGGATVAALTPRMRPKDVGNRVVASAGASARPAIPSNTDVAARATQSGAMRLARVNLLGISGSASTRKALVRVSSGRVVKVGPGDRLDGGRVVSIAATSLTYQKNGRTVVLQMPRG